MSMTDLELEKPPMITRWWNGWQSMQTLAFTVGWVVGVPAGALAAIAWGLWTTQVTYKQVLAQEAALVTRVDALEKVNESGNTERASMRDRLTRLETQVGPKIITSELLERYGSHIDALDGRSDEIKRGMDEMRATLQAQITGLCVEIRGIGASSGKKARSCP